MSTDYCCFAAAVAAAALAAACLCCYCKHRVTIMIELTEIKETKYQYHSIIHLQSYCIFSEAEMLRNGYPAYTTSVGWLGYDDGKINRVIILYKF